MMHLFQIHLIYVKSEICQQKLWCVVGMCVAQHFTVSFNDRVNPSSLRTSSTSNSKASTNTKCISHTSSCAYPRLSVPLARDLHRALANEDKPQVHRSGNMALSVQVTVEEPGSE